MAVVAVGGGSGAVYADSGVNKVQTDVQLIEVEATDIAGAVSATQRVIVVTDMEDMAIQRVVVSIVKPDLALAVSGPGTVDIEPGGATGTGEVKVQVYAGSEAGYTLEYEFLDENLMCEMDHRVVIPTIASAGILTGSTWGHNVTTTGQVPVTWLPAVLTPTVFAQTNDGMDDDEIDDWYMAVGAKAETTKASCVYGNVLVFTLTGN